MKTICAWCLKHISGNPDDTKITHGICPACKTEQLEIVKKLKKNKQTKAPSN